MHLWGLLRAIAISSKAPLDQQDLRGWHAVINGGILLQLSPYGFHEGMNGRYAFTSDSFERCKQAINQVGNILQKCQKDIKAIYTFPDRDSQILANAASKLLNLPIKDLDDIGTNGLLVVYDWHFSQITDEQFESIKDHRKHLVFWEHATNWFSPFPLSRDISTYLHQHNNSPWGERMQVNQDTQEAETIGADTRSISEIAEDIVQAGEFNESEDGFMDIVDPAEMILTLKDLPEQHLPGVFKEGGQRMRFQRGSPVRSSYFSWGIFLIAIP